MGETDLTTAEDTFCEDSSHSPKNNLSYCNEMKKLDELDLQDQVEELDQQSPSKMTDILQDQDLHKELKKDQVNDVVSTQNDDFFARSSEMDDFNVLNSTKVDDVDNFFDLELSPVRSLKSRLEMLKEKAANSSLQPTNLQQTYQYGEVLFKMQNKNLHELKDTSAFQEMKNRFAVFRQLKKEEEERNNPNMHPHLDPTEKSNCKLLALKKSLKQKMSERRRQEYEKRVKMYKDEFDYKEAEKEEELLIDEDEEELIKSDEPSLQNLEDDEENEAILKEDNYKDDEMTPVSSQCSQPLTQHVILSPKDFDDKKSNENLFVENQKTLQSLLGSQPTTQFEADNIFDLCSGKVKGAEVTEEDDEEDAPDSFIEKLDNEDDSFKSEEEITQDVEQEDSQIEPEVIRKKYNFDSDDEDICDFTKRLNFKLKTNRPLIEDDDDSQSNTIKSISQDNDDNEETLQEPVKKLKYRDFVEDQAELSEEDAENVSSDEDENEPNEYEQEEIVEDLPSDEEILEQNNKMFWKQQRDEDKRELLEYQERFLENGDLEGDGETRKRKFKWKHADNGAWVDNARDSDSDEFDFNDEDIEYTSMHLKPLTKLNDDNSQSLGEGKKEASEETEDKESSGENMTKSQRQETSMNRSILNSFSTLNNSSIRRHMKGFRKELVNGPSSDIKSYIIKDKNLLNAMSLKRTSSTTNKTNNKRIKTDIKKDGKSIFDTFQF